ncbi:MAG: CinA family nicotinamide mononucleotide deamidase-related protein [Opitutales bacterium]
MAKAVTLDLITVGDELLLGLRDNTHIATIGAQLGRSGLFIRRSVTCTDEQAAIQENIRHALDTGAHIVLLTGGLGPTQDDRTREALAAELGLEMEFVPEIEAGIRERFAKMNAQFTENNLRQCYRPAGAEVLPNPFGTAPGILIRHNGVLIFAIPGPTPEMQPMLVEQVVPRICDQGFCNWGEAFLQIRTCGVGESMLENRLQPIFDRNPSVDVAFCAHQGMVDIRLSTEQADFTQNQLRAVADECRVELGPDFCCFGHDTLAKVVFDFLRAGELTLSVAESATGGLLANAFTDIPGASKVFHGGVVCYNNDAKQDMLGVPEDMLVQHGAVSAEVAVAMADGAAEKFGTEYALSITGYAGPSGGTPQNPVGTIYIGYHSPIGSWCVKMVRPGERTQVKHRAVTRALDVARRKLLKYSVADACATMLQS